jgi:hypothetical protein
VGTELLRIPSDSGIPGIGGTRSVSSMSLILNDDRVPGIGGTDSEGGTDSQGGTDCQGGTDFEGGTGSAMLNIAE